MAIIELWGWSTDPDAETAKRRNSDALDEIESEYLKHFPNEHVISVLCKAADPAEVTAVHIIVNCSFDMGSLNRKRKDRIEQALAGIYRKHFPERQGAVKTTLR